MTDNERDTKFAGFAKLLWDELKEFDPYDFDLRSKGSWQVLHSGGGEGFDPTILEEHIQRIIAQRAYDLAYHILYETSPGMERVFGIPYKLEHLPDLKKWPDSPDPE
jgi:hypothetical protein